MRRIAFLAAASALLLTGCAGNPSQLQQPEEPVSQQAATTEASQRAKVHTELGGLYLSRGNLGVALDEARKALSADDRYAPAHNLMGLVHMQLHEDRLAEQSFERALSLAPSDPEINNSFGWFLCQTGRERRSLQYFQTAVKSPLYATPTMPYTNAGICSLRLKDDKAAEDYFLKALRADHANARAMFFLADIDYRRGRLDEARHYLDELHQRVEPTAEILWLGVKIERGLGDRGAEEHYAFQLRSKFPGSPEARRLLQGQYQ
ncbi:MAG TPA: type IV pilus biogenesis/stability protein PilW [Rhodocyclaceae bacterium]|nr:type IV pilus biogenesis/stability protein PilW [Rhodocyclaceae bacterium]